MEELRPLKFIQDELEYLTVMETIDPEDWGRPGADPRTEEGTECDRPNSTSAISMR